MLSQFKNLPSVTLDRGVYVPGSNNYTWGDVLGSKSNNTIPIEHRDNLIITVQYILEPITSFMGHKLSLSSGYRDYVPHGGSTTSDHLRGRAFDIIGETKKIFYFIKDNLQYDQLIWETTDFGGSPPTDGEPRWVHVGFRLNSNRSQLFYFHNHKNQHFNSWTSGGKETSEQEPPNAQPKTPPLTVKDLNKKNNVNDRILSNLYKQIDTNMRNIEMGEVDADWGQRSSVEEDSDWISLKQFLLYLATRYSPQSVYPFFELIPSVSMDNTFDPYQDKEGGDKIAKNNSMARKYSKKISDSKRGVASEEAINKASNLADLTTIDPYKEGYDEYGVFSKGGEAIYKERHLGVRVYAQLVLTPGAFENSPSKPGGIGFKKLIVNAGAQCENGLAKIKMEIVDVQGNKFTDLASPWSFIYDSRPGAVKGDFYFRYGWQIRLPSPDSNTIESKRFWSHPGWKLFGQNIKEGIASQIFETKPFVTLTQGINGMLSTETFTDKYGKKHNKGDYGLYSLFDEGITFSESDGTVLVERESLNQSNYIKLAILNPELDVAPTGEITANLTFMTTGSQALSVPLQYSRFLKKIVSQTSSMSLADIIMLTMADTQAYQMYSIDDKKKRETLIRSLKTQLKNIQKTGDMSGIVYLVGGTGGNNSLDPSNIKIKISNKLREQILSPDKESVITIIGWIRGVLEDNGCELSSAATGSGVGINSAWVITVSEDVEIYNIRKGTSYNTETKEQNIIQTMINEVDVFGFRFQGSLVENLKLKQGESPNAVSINADYTLAGVSSEDFDYDSGVAKDRPITVEDRRNVLNIVFSQLWNVNVTALAHPWLAPGKDFYIKGFGMFDAKYVILSVTHEMSLGSFSSTIEGARILESGKEEDDREHNKNLVENENKNITKQVNKQIE